MEITLVGWLCIAVGLANALRPMRLAVLMAATVVFSATAVVNFPGVPFGLQPYHWFGSLLVVSVFLLEPAPLLSGFVAARTGFLALLAFLAWGFVGTAAMGSSRASLVHMGHLCLGVAIAIAVRRAVRDRGDLLALARAFVFGATAAALWGILQLVLFIVGIEYPAGIFNNSVGDSAGGYVSTVADGLLPRVSSVSTEPSTLVRTLLPALLIIALLPEASIARRTAQHGKLASDWTAWALLAATLLSTSTTGLVGLGAIALGVVILVPRYRARTLGTVVAAATAAYIAVKDNPIFIALSEELVTSKVELGSGSLRADSVQQAFAEFLSSPVIGAGPAAVTSDDLIVKLLANYGVVGAGLFLVALGAVTLAAVRALREHRDTGWRPLLVAFMAANAVLWIMDAAGGLTYTYGTFWLLWALLATAVDRCAVEEPAVRIGDRSDNPELVMEQG